MNRTSKPQLLNYGIATLSPTREGELPTEFRVFAAGVNRTRNGYDVLFDEEAAKTVMASAAEHPVDLMLDLEHLSIDSNSPHYDTDARAWLQLEVRRDSNGGPELWAVNVRWTPDGARRLTERTQRYVSPAFHRDANNRPIRVVNIALVSMPALDNTAALVAASQQPKRPSMLSVFSILRTLEGVQKLSTAGIAPNVIVRTLAEGDGAGEVAGVNLAELAAMLGVTEDPGQDPAGFIGALNGKLDEIRAKLSGEKAPPKTPDSAEDMPAEEVAAAREMMRLDGVSTLSAVRTQHIRYRDAFIRNEATLAKLAEERRVLETNERSELCGKLVAAHLEDSESIKDLAALSLERLRERVKSSLERKALIDSVPNAGRTALRGAPGEVATLSAREQKMCVEMKIDPKEYAAQKAAIAARKAG